jgi:hypothetical protein
VGEVETNRASFGGVKLTQRKYLHPNATVSTHTTTATIITTSTTTTAAIKTVGIQAKNLECIESVWN